MVNVAIAGMAVMYIRTTAEHVPATIIGPSTHGDEFFHVKYMQNGHDIDHHAPLDCVVFPIHSNCGEGEMWAGFHYIHSFGPALFAQAWPCPSTGPV